MSDTEILALLLFSKLQALTDQVQVTDQAFASLILGMNPSDVFGFQETLHAGCVFNVKIGRTPGG